ncbi:hypothetical protein [Planctobacterium marinum]|uniref:Cell envelope biogenesis protein TonB n=1 Tax=Planctobacterium marinum TaxID=1631968 RepID=A0AA48HRV8_9ALTE|nr:cell envelope biogenesis protein TonB [Planctobacterium marinum]
MRLIFVSLFIIFISACANTGTSEPFLNQTPITQYDSLNDYWLSDKKMQPLRYLTKEQYKHMKGKKIKIEAKYLIDSNGDVHHVEILKSNVDIPMESLVKKTLQKQDFYPSQSNSSKRPIIAYAGLEFACN